MQNIRHNAIPAEAQYLITPTSNNVITDTQTSRFNPRGANSFTYDGTNVIRFDIASNPNYFMNGKNSYLTFDHHVLGIPADGGGHTYRAYFQNAHSWIKRVRIVTQSGDVLEDIDDYNLLYNMLSDATIGTDYRASMSGALVGFSPAAAPISKFNQVITTYNISLLSGVLKMEKFMPTGFLPFVIEIYLDRPTNCHQVIDTANALAPFNLAGLTYVISNAYYVGEMPILESKYVEAFSQKVMNDGVALTYHTHTHSLSSVDSTVVNFRVGENIKNIKTVHAVMRIPTNQNKTDEDSFTYVDSDIVEYQFSSGSSLYPIQPIQCATSNAAAGLGGNNCKEAYAEVLKALRYFNDISHTTILTDANYNSGNNASTKFMIGQEFERDSVASFSSALKTMDHRLSLYMKLAKMPVGGAGTVVIDAFTHYDKLVTIHAGGRIDDKFR
jgi:hypothetical protein